MSKPEKPERLRFSYNSAFEEPDDSLYVCHAAEDCNKLYSNRRWAMKHLVKVHGWKWWDNNNVYNPGLAS